MPVGEGVTDQTVSAPAGLPHLKKLTELVYGPIRDTSHEFVEEWFVIDMLNEAYVDLNARLRLLKNTTTGTTDASGLITIPTDAVEFDNLWFGTLPAAFVDDDTFLSYKNFGVTPFDQLDITAQLARVNVGTGKIETYPVVNAGAYTLEYVKRPDLMVAQTDIPTALTRELIPRIVRYARAHAYWQDGKESEGAREMALYEQGLPGAPREAFRRRPYTMSLIPESGPYG